MEHVPQIGLKALGYAGAAGILAGGGVPYAGAKSRPSQANRVVPGPGIVIPVKFDTKISSNQTRRRGNFTANVHGTKTASRAIMHGGIVCGILRQATPRKGGTPGLPDWNFTRLNLPDSRSFAVALHVRDVISSGPLQNRLHRGDIRPKAYGH